MNFRMKMVGEIVHQKSLTERGKCSKTRGLRRYLLWCHQILVQRIFLNFAYLTGNLNDYGMKQRCFHVKID
ncbi:hypothetical protein CISIN_1g037883mg [Citrus sinensis]|uniref:Uncharacterized protein n=1 Tax=Citrus sinensis TaxID=2711 RepID=A0A067F2R1_CITSI|nr:hypothetical protein CISIN_1g037883mg [Citrus sinensis]